MTTTHTRCVQWPTLVNNAVNGEYGVCYQSYPIYDRITSTHSLAFSSVRGELILPITLHRDQRIVNLNEFTHAGDWHRIHESLNEVVGTHLLFLNVRTKAVRSTYRSGAEISRVAVADDGRTLVARRVFRRLNIVHNVATGGGTYRSQSCNATFQRIVDAPASVSTQQVFYVDGGSRSSCLPGATFGS